MSKKIANISQQECLNYSRILVRQSHKRFIKAKKRANEGEYGDAITQEILGAEELMKAFIVALDGNGFRFRNIKSLNNIFENHGLRYFQAFFMFAMGVISEDFMSILKYVKKNPQNIPRLHKLIKNNKIQQKKIQKRVEKYGIRKFIYFRREFLWFIRIDTLRQKSMYTDYNHVILNPDDFTYEDYVEVRDRLKKVRAGAIGIIRTFNDPTLSHIIALYKKKIKEEDIYNKIDKSIRFVNQTAWKKMSDKEIIKLEWITKWKDYEDSIE